MNIYKFLNIYFASNPVLNKKENVSYGLRRHRSMGNRR